MKQLIMFLVMCSATCFAQPTEQELEQFGIYVKTWVESGEGDIRHEQEKQILTLLMKSSRHQFNTASISKSFLLGLMQFMDSGANVHPIESLFDDLLQQFGVENAIWCCGEMFTFGEHDITELYHNLHNILVETHPQIKH